MGLLSRVLRQFRHQEFVILSMLLALALWRFPLQKYVTLARFQHYGLAILVWSLGFFLQAVWSWPRIRKWTRVVLVMTAVYLAVFGSILYSNPWLDPSISLQTSEQVDLRQTYTFICIGLGFILSMIWWHWSGEEIRQREAKQTELKD